MSLPERKQVLGLLDVKVRVTGWHSCERCMSSGRVANGSEFGGEVCPASNGNRFLPNLFMSGRSTRRCAGPDSQIGEAGVSSERQRAPELVSDTAPDSPNAGRPNAATSVRRSASCGR